MTTYSDPSAQRFFEMLDRVDAEAAASPAGKVLLAAGFHTQHTGGGCMAWQLDEVTFDPTDERRPGGDPKWFCFITDDGGADLGTDVVDPENANWIVGLYDVNWDTECVNLFFPKLSDAIAWCKEALKAPEETQIATRWVEVLGLGFHPDTSGRDILPPLAPYQIIDYERDMERLHEISADPYLAGLRAMKVAHPDCFPDLPEPPEPPKAVMRAAAVQHRFDDTVDDATHAAIEHFAWMPLPVGPGQIALLERLNDAITKIMVEYLPD